MIPKGNLDDDGSPHSDAACEAEEEAGVRGILGPTPLGTFRYLKRMESGESILAEVVVFRLDVTEELADWKERAERDRRWFSVADAAAAVDEPELSDLILAFR